MMQLVQKTNPINKRLSEQRRQKRKKLVASPSPKTCCYSFDINKRTFARPGKPDLTDTHVPGLPFREPSAIPNWLDLAVLGTYFYNFGEW